MYSAPEIRTERLFLRRWRLGDRLSFAALNSDPEVLAYFPAVLARAESDALADRIEASFEVRGFGLWAVEVIDGAPFIGFIGLEIPQFEAGFTPCVEVGWRLARQSWGRGYATEGALAALAFGFDTVGLEEIVSFTSASNVRSRAVMERIGMTRDPADDFEHPSLPQGHALRQHVLYRIASAGMPEFKSEVQHLRF